MKKISLILALLMMFTAISGCVMPEKKSETAFLTVFKGEDYMQEWSSEYGEVIAKATYPYISIKGAEKFPELSKTLHNLNKEKDDNKENWFRELTKEGYDWCSVATEGYNTFSSINNVKVIRADEKVLSLLFCGYEYRGGMHGIEYYSGESYDVATGEKIDITDVIKDVDGLSEAVSTELYEHYYDVEFFENIDIKESLESEYLSWTYDYNGITVYFGIYELAPYAYGTQAVNITYDEYPELFNEEIKTPAYFTTEMTNGIPLFSDTDKDGESERIYYTAWGSETGEDGTFCIYIDDEIYEEKIYFYDADVTFIKSEKGTYLYAEFSMDNDYRETRVYEIKDKAEYVGTVNGAKAKFFTGTGLNEESVITDPDDFLLETRTYILSTATGYKNYSIGDDGMPVSDEKEYKFGYSIDLTVLEEFTAEVMEDDKTIGEVSIKKGEILLYVATDNEKYVWFETEDYKIIRKEFTKDGYEIFIDGKSSYDVFDGMFFAG